jgi:hypothetical protein
MNVYHFTDVYRLSWIIAAKQLEGGRNQIGGYPDPDFIWATTCEQGDRTASGMENYRKGETPLVRFTLSGEDFEPWSLVTERHPQWKAEHVHTLEAVARRKYKETGFSQWRIRAEPLPISRVIAVEAKTYRTRWQPVELIEERRIHPGFRAISFGGHVYASARVIELGRPAGFIPAKVAPEVWRAGEDLLLALKAKQEAVQ